MSAHEKWCLVLLFLDSFVLGFVAAHYWHKSRLLKERIEHERSVLRVLPKNSDRS